MKRFSTFITLLTLTIPLSASILYVNDNATGADNGSSWEDAYTDLQLALAEAPDTIFIAMGLYKPAAQGEDPAATFMIDQNLVIWGGFSDDGQERNPIDFPTILSGDLNDNDEPGNFYVNRDDNVNHVMTIAGDASLSVILDGLFIEHGQADGPQLLMRFGGGIHALGNLNLSINACFFKENYSFLRGGALYSSETNLNLTQSTFYQNQSNRGGGAFLKETQHWIDQCEFRENYTEIGNASPIGAGLRIEDSQGTIQNCMFQENYGAGFGAGLAVYNTMVKNIDLEIADCLFEKNTSEGGGGGLYLFNVSDSASVQIKRCSLIQNVAHFGGGMHLAIDGYSEHPEILIDSCYFSENTAYWTEGGGLRVILNGNDMQVALTNSFFLKNEATYAGGGASFFGSDEGVGFPKGNFLIDACTFRENVSANYAGGLSIGAGPDLDFFEYMVSNCLFEENESSNYAGGLDLYAVAPSLMQVEKCDFFRNTTNGLGGGIGITVTTPDFSAQVSNCHLEGNEGEEGAAIGLDPTYAENAGITTQEADILFVNCLMTDHIGVKGLVFARNTGLMRLLNCTLADNAVGGVGLDGFATASIQNTIFFNDSLTEVTTYSNDAILISEGGNLLKDNSIEGLEHPYDQLGKNPFFNQTGLQPYGLSENSPAIDAGHDTGDLPLFDAAGNDRIINCVDIGAFESSEVVAVKCLTPLSTDEKNKYQILELSPNPASEYLQFQFSEGLAGEVEMTLYNLRGTVLKKQTLREGERLFVAQLLPGVYVIQLRAGDQLYVGKFVKQ